MNRASVKLGFAGLALALSGVALWHLVAPDLRPDQGRVGALQASPAYLSVRDPDARRESGAASRPGRLQTSPTVERAPSGAWQNVVSTIHALLGFGAAEALVNLASMTGETIPALLDTCRSNLSAPASRWALIEGLKSPEPGVALAAARMLMQFPGADAGPALAEAARSGDPAMRGTALQALVAMGAPAGLELARVAIEGNDPHLAQAAAESLLLGDSSEGKQLLERVSRSGDPRQRATAAMAYSLVDQPGSEVIAKMVSLAVDPEREVRGPVLSALSQIGTSDAIGPVLDAAARGQPPDRAYALELLGNVTDQRAGSLIAFAISDPSAQVAAAAMLASAYRLGVEVDDAIASRLIDMTAAVEVRQAAAIALRQHSGPLARLYATQIDELVSGSGEP